MKRPRDTRGAAALLPFFVLSTVLAATAQPARAHEFIQRYDLPVPLSVYLYGCAGTLVATFLLIGWFVARPAGVPPASSPAVGLKLSKVVVPNGMIACLRAVALACLILTIVVAIIGTTNPDRNLSLMLFWIVFLLCFTYVTAFIGNLYESINPWKTLVAGVERTNAWRISTKRYPEWLGYWPALAFYMALVWIELFVLPQPRVLAIALIAYSVITVAGVCFFGRDAWFRFADVFSVLFRAVGTLAPIGYHRRANDNMLEFEWRWPLAGAIFQKADRISLVVFVLFLLSSTTYDGIHGTIFWMGLYWNHLLTFLQPLWGNDLIAAQATLEKWYVVYQRAGLVLSPFLYLVIYIAIMALVKLFTKTAMPLRTLALEFGYSVVPIALVYSAAHYLTLLAVELPKLPHLLSDPLGLGWNLFHLQPLLSEPPPLAMPVIWHTEVGLILAGHVASVYLAHRIAVRLFGTRREAIVSQLPMLALMVTYTIIGLWVISLPFALT